MINKLPKDYYYKDLKGNRIGYDEDMLNGKEKQVLIDKLPSNYNYKKLDNDKSPDSNKKQVFKYEEDNIFNSSYLVMESGKKYKLNEEDTKFLKERGVK